jgi:transcriptional regulator with XRE-family HTH domain
MDAPEIDRAIGRQIVNVLAREGMANVDLAQALGTHEANVSRWLNGRTAISLDWLARIARVLRLTVADLLPPEEQAAGSEYRVAWTALERMSANDRAALIEGVTAIARAMREQQSSAYPHAGRIERVS